MLGSLFFSRWDFDFPYVYILPGKQCIISSYIWFGPKTCVFLCQLIGSSYCNTAGYIHHFFSDSFIFGKENENVFIIIRFLP